MQQLEHFRQMSMELELRCCPSRELRSECHLEQGGSEQQRREVAEYLYLHELNHRIHLQTVQRECTLTDSCVDFVFVKVVETIFHDFFHEFVIEH